MSALAGLLRAAGEGRELDDDAARRLGGVDDLAALLPAAARLRDAHHGERISYSRKVFIPLTHLCRDVCHYCTFARPPRRGEAAYMTPEAVLAIARAGAAAGCHEALFTLGDKPELRYRAAREELARLGHASTIDYLAAMSALVLTETGLLPHANPGVMSAEEIARLRRVSVSQGIMLESAAERLCEKGGPHWGSPDKRPSVRLATIAEAGRQRVPFTSGLLIGIGETRAERVETLLALRAQHRAHGHLQEVIVQNFRAKPGTRMAGAAEPDLDDLLWTIAVARLILGGAANIQAPPNLSPGTFGRLVAAGLNDWGGVSPVTPDHVNPEAPWPHLEALAAATHAAGKTLVPRLAAYPAYVRDAARWVDAAVLPATLRLADAEGYAREDAWLTGSGGAALLPAPRGRAATVPLAAILDQAAAGAGLGEAEIVRLFQARGDDLHAVVDAADALRRRVSGDVVRYVVNRNINYTNICYFRCQFCAFSKGKLSENLRGSPYDLGVEEIVRRAEEAWARGATEVCLQGGIHPEYTGETYLAIARGIRAALPEMHIHAFSPLEVWQGAKTLGFTLEAFLRELKSAGLGTLPGTAAEVLDDEIRRVICPDKVTTEQWLEVIGTAHAVGLRTTATIMFGHVEGYEHWARHLLRLRALQATTGGLSEFVPLPFVAGEAPIYLKGRARRGPTLREAVLMHAVARLALHPLVTNIQASWVKMGPEGVLACLAAGANDLGGTLMNESITRAAGAEHGQEMPPAAMEALIRRAGRDPAQRTTLYGDVPAARVAASFAAAPLTPTVNPPAVKYARKPDRALVRPGLEGAAPAAE